MLKVTGYLSIFILLSFFIMLVFMTISETKKVQSFHEVLDEKIDIEDISLPQTSYIKDGNGQVISEIYRPMNRIYLQTEEIPSFLKDLFIVSEDQHFYDHPGFDLPAISRALAINLSSNDIEQGASTITQQLARNLFLTHEQTYNRKLSELLYAYELERKYSKEEILELYVNAIYFQNGAYGIEAAAQTYFQKQTKDLSKAELAFLASIPNNPSYYDPIRYFAHTKARQERVIDQLSTQKLLSPEEAEKLKGEKITLNEKKRIDLFPDYVTYVEAELKELIAYQEGFTEKMANANEQERLVIEQQLEKRVEVVYRSGIVIETALHPDLQKKAKEAITQHLPYQDIEGSAVVIDHTVHEIIAVTGGKEYGKYNFHRAYQAYRQPGSAIKPLLDYAPYFERTQASVKELINANAFCEDGYCPQNYGGGQYGNVTLEQAFKYSYNTPAVRLLAEIGVENGFRDLSAFQFKQVTNEDHVLAAAIGGFSKGMTPLELTSAYTVFASDGNYQRARAIRAITKINGEELYRWDDQPVQVWSKQTVEKIRDLMKKTVQSGTAKQASLPLGYAGGKTGTTNDYKDYWFIGLTDHLTAGVWVGKDIPENMKYIESALPQLHIWKDMMTD